MDKVLRIKGTLCDVLQDCHESHYVHILDMYVNSIAMKYFQRLMISFISLAWVTAMASGTAMGFGIVASILGSRFGSANIIVLGGVTCAVGLFSSSFVGSIYPLYMTYGLFFGFGQCLCFCSSLFVLPTFFQVRLGLANGIVFVGGPVGSLILATVMQQLVNNFGFATTFQILAGLHAVPVLCGIVINFIPSPDEVGQSDVNNERQKTGFDLSLFLRGLTT